MALLGTFWQNLGPISLAPVTGGLAYGVKLANYQHSLPTIPEFVTPVMTSIQALAVPPPVNLLQNGGNASQVTAGVLIGSCASVPVVAFDLWAAMIHSSIR